MSDEEENEYVSDLPDSISWGTASKGSAKKVYFDIIKSPKDAGTKVARIKLLERLALDIIDIDKYNEECEKIK